MDRLRTALIALPLALAACAPTKTAEPVAADHATTQAIPDLPTVEIIAWALIPTEHPTYATIGGLSGALFRPHRTPEGLTSPLDERSMAPVEFVSDHPQTPRTLHAALALRKTNGAYALEIDFDFEDRLEWTDAKDAEAIARFPTEAGEIYAIAFEAPPTVAVREFDPTAPWRVRYHTPTIPDNVTTNARPNRAFESVAFTPDGTIWAATEAALETDGAEANIGAGTPCVVLRGNADALVETYFYETEPLPRHMGESFAIQSLVELEPLPDGRMLALERSLTLPLGFAARLFLIDGSTRPAPTDPAAYPPRLPILNKFQVADLRTLALDAGVPWIGNLEGLALGPTIAELTGDDTETGRLLLVVADDNFGADLQRGSRLIALRFTDR